MAFGTYLMGGQHLSVARRADLKSEVLGTPISTGYLSGLPGWTAEAWRDSIPRSVTG